MIIKRIFDLFLSIAVLFLLGPILILIGILIKLNLGSPILFKQERIGKNNVKFKMYKFRTMKEAVDKEGNSLPDRERLTSFGKVLRSTSLDELPEFINIVKGDMSLIGPRPLLVEYLPLYSKEQLKRHLVLPGITGLAQVNGRNAITFTEKFKLDVWYVENFSIRLDIKIFFLTIYKVIKREGISEEGQATASYFDGTN